MSPVSPFIIIKISDRQAAAFRVLGLSILERNLRQLAAAGLEYQLVDGQETVVDSSWTGVILRGDCQYPNHYFSVLKTRDGDHPVEMQNVAQLLCEFGPKKTERILSQKLFQEILEKTEGWIARSLNKKISFFLTSFLVRTPVTPNQITAGNFFIGIVGCLLLTSLNWHWRVFGAFLIQVNSILDGCDGEVARLKVVRSKLGAWMDTVTDDVLNNVMFVCLYVGYYYQYRPRFMLEVCIATTFASFGVSFFIYRYLVKHGTQNAADYRLSWDKGGSKISEPSLFDRIKPVLKRDFIIFTVFVFVILDLRLPLIALFVPVWGAFFLYLASYLYESRKHFSKIP